MMMNVVIIGAGGHGRVVLDVLRAMGKFAVKGFIDADAGKVGQAAAPRTDVRGAVDSVQREPLTDVRGAVSPANPCTINPGASLPEPFPRLRRPVQTGHGPA